LVAAGFDSLAKSHGVAVLVPTENLGAPVRFHGHAKDGRFDFADGTLLGFDHRGFVVER
jgi:hypothetical protein